MSKTRTMVVFKFVLLSFVFSLSGCAVLHHVQVGEIISPEGYVLKPFDIKISETGISVGEAKELAKVFLDAEGKKRAEEIAAIIGLFQMGPTTGNPVYTPNYAKELFEVIYEKCPSGKITGITSVRETRKYPVISGEIVRIRGYCLIQKG